MDWKTLVVELATIVGALAAIIAILNGIYELRENRKKGRPADLPPPGDPPASAVQPPTPPAPPRKRLSNLPSQPTMLVGRERELAAVQELLLRPDVRLVTLTGEAGIGKTRLALQVAAGLRDRFADGVFFVPLAPVTDPELVVPTIAQVLQLQEQGDRPLINLLQDYLAEKQMLLVLDNFEQVMSASRHVGEILAAAAGVKLLATSRELLHVYGEHLFVVPPLALPSPEELSGASDLVATLGKYESVQLFVERAQAAQSDFALTNENARAVAEICGRLDGLPLAIELAAARVRLLPPHAMLPRLVDAAAGSSLGLLASGARDLPARQRTLRDTISWSYDLLDPHERTLFQQLGVFAGGWTLDAAASVTSSAARGEASTSPGPERGDILEDLDSLISKSLVRHAEHAHAEPAHAEHAHAGQRFLMLQTIREYALERLAEAGLDKATRDAHAAWYAGLVEQAEPALYGASQAEWLHRLDAESENLRAALAWFLQSGQRLAALEFAGNLARYWNLRGRVSEGRGWLEAALAADGNQDVDGEGRRVTTARARALQGLAEVVSNQGEWPKVWASLEESIRISRELGESRLLARSLASLSLFRVRGAGGDGASSEPLAEESLRLARSAGDPWLLGYVLTLLDARRLLLDRHDDGPAGSEEALACFEETGDRGGQVLALRHIAYRALGQGNYSAARAAGERSLDASRGLGDRLGETYTLSTLGDIARLQEDYEAAERYYQESLAIQRELGLKADIPASLHSLGYVALARGDMSRAVALQAQSLALHRQNGNQAGTLEALGGVAAVSRAKGDLNRAAHLFAAAEALSASLNVPAWPGEQREHERQVSLLRDELGGPELARLWDEGRGMTLHQAVEEALEAGPSDAPAHAEEEGVPADSAGADRGGAQGATTESAPVARGR